MNTIITINPHYHTLIIIMLLPSWVKGLAGRPDRHSDANVSLTILLAQDWYLAWDLSQGSFILNLDSLPLSLVHSKRNFRLTLDQNRSMIESYPFVSCKLGKQSLEAWNRLELRRRSSWKCWEIPTALVDCSFVGFMVITNIFISSDDTWRNEMVNQ